MSILDVLLSSDAVLRIRDILICLSRFNETVDIDATADQFTLSALNSARTSFASFKLDRDVFFLSYTFVPTTSARFSCQVLNKAFFSIFKTRGTDARDQGTSIERCEITVSEGTDQAECRLTAKLTCMHGVKKTFKLTYEPKDTLYPSFNSRTSQNTWTISAQALRTLTDHFGPRAEHIDFFHDAGRLMLTGYTEKIARGTEILKQPLQTTITLDRLDFDDFGVEEHVHVGISVKDFKAILQHADSLHVAVKATYSWPTKPLQLTYGDSGMQCSFTLVTMSEYLGTSIKTAQPSPSKPAKLSTMAFPGQKGQKFSHQDLQMEAAAKMPAPVQPASRSFTRETTGHVVERPSPPPPQASINQESLFLDDDADEDDRQWGPQEYTEDADTVRWDSGNELPTRTSFSTHGPSRMSTVSGYGPAEENEVPPTQRMSQIRGLFDE